MTLTSRRQPPPLNPDTISNQTWEASRGTVARFLRWSKDFFSSIPGGFPGTTPTAITPDSEGDSGLEASGWAAADHDHPIETASATDLANANAEGSADSFARSDHQHKRDVRVKSDGVDVGTRNALNFREGFTVTDDSANDRVNVRISSAAASTTRQARADVNDYILHRAVHAESYIVAITTGKI